jgi:hypothetical protein
MQYTINIPANQEIRAQISGRTLALLSTGAAASVDIKIEITGFAVEELRGQKRGFKVRTPGFDGVRLFSTVATTIEVFTSVADIELSLEGQTVSANITNTPLAVVPDRGAPGNPVYVSGVTYTDAPATSMLNTGPVAVAAVAVSVMAANSARKAARFTNVGTDAVALGATGITWAKRCIVLEPGDVWSEDSAANLQWFAICDTAKTASVNVQEVMA